MNCSILMLAALLLAGPRPAPAAQTPVATTHPVQAPARGYLVDIFFVAGEPVKLGQLLAKLELPYGNPAYLLASATGRIGAPSKQLGDAMSQHAVLAVIETAPTPSRPR